MRSSRFALLGWAWVLLLLLTACRPVIQVSLVADARRLPAPRFTVVDPEHEDRPRYTTVQVLDRAGEMYWQLRAEPYGDMASVASLTYGESPPGFTVLDGPRALQPGGRYALYVVGKNRGTLHFDVDAEGHVTEADP
ncbi:MULTISPECIES: hypothetical protein [unclassified Corallococcus]|uniref:hypothetical protein n=1 Tax=unclassified Corallococcus TaxID=2685029 RepID=UPI001A8DD4AF|nr:MULTISPECIES: hypothetical protein [unclassified Corallococcus]MBN9687811.1 hypothetical protein [Corallococcus sp. NCSPR001]WAS88377.1 hypothetical protein O0N60_15635 [Corallococcus sp. NCRR]